MNGVLIVDKPIGITSHDVIYRVRRILKIKSVGHTGTLDPFATGVLVVLIGNATRLAQFLDKAEKEYLATIRFGFETDTGDRTGSPKSKVQSPKSISDQEVAAVLSKFTGEIWQTPPMYSAKKIHGKKLYELAREGVEVERQPIKIKISALELVPDSINSAEFENSSNPIADNSLQSAVVRVICTAGTYVRTLAEDIGRELNTGAHLQELRRTRAGNFDLSQAVTLEELENLAGANNVEKVLISPNRALAHLPFVSMTENEIAKTLNGNKLAVLNDFEENEFVRMCGEHEDLIAIGVYDFQARAVQPRVVLK